MKWSLTVTGVLTCWHRRTWLYVCWSPGGRRSGRTDDSQPDGNPHSTKVQSAATTSTAANTAQPLTEAAPPATTNTTTDTTTDTTTTDTTTTTTAVTRAPVVIPSTATATTKTDSNSGASPVEGRGQKVGKKVRKEPGLKPSDARQRKGETSLLIEQCGDGVVEGAMRGERGEVGRRLGDVLGWTSHLGEVALSLLTHCHTAPRKSQMRQVAGEVDRLAPLLMEAARFVAAGDTTQADALRLLADDWISACGRLVIMVDVCVVCSQCGRLVIMVDVCVVCSQCGRLVIMVDVCVVCSQCGRLVIMVDVAAGDWLLLIESITQAVTDRDTQALKSLRNCVHGTYGSRAMDKEAYVGHMDKEAYVGHMDKEAYVGHVDKEAYVGHVDKEAYVGHMDKEAYVGHMDKEAYVGHVDKEAYVGHMDKEAYVGHMDKEAYVGHVDKEAYVVHMDKEAYVGHVDKEAYLSILDRSQREMSRLLARAEQVEVGQVAGGADLLHFFHHARPELDNLTATLKTTADCLATTGEGGFVSLATTEDSNAVTRTQLLQRGREWGVLVTCLVSQLDWMADHLSTAAQATLGIAVGPTSAASGLGPYGGAASKVVPLLQTHTTRLKEVLGALTAGGESLVKKRSEELSHSLSSLLGEVEEIAQTPVDDHTLPQAQLFARLDAGLARSRWTGKALEAEQLVQRHCHRYSLLVTNLLLSPRMTEVQDVQERLRLVSQRSLQAIQLSPDLQHRATVRRCLDQLTALMPGIAEKVTDHLSGVGGEGARQEVRAAAVQWGARVHCLLSTLRAMSDVRAAPINEIEKLLSGLPHETSAPTPPSLPPASLPTLPPTTSVPLHTSLPTHQAPLPHTRGGASPARRETPGAAAPRAASQREAPGYGGRPAQGQHPPRTPGRWSPAEHALTPSQPGQDDPFCSAVVEEGGSPVMPMSPYRRSALYTSWLASARYLGEEVAEWEDSDNHFVQLVRSMAQHCQHMADFARGGTSLKVQRGSVLTADCEEVSSAGLALAASGRQLETFARCLLAMCPPHSGRQLETFARCLLAMCPPHRSVCLSVCLTVCLALAASGRQLETFARCLLAMCPPHRSQEDLQKAADRIATYCNQLHIVSTVLINAPAHPQGDCILARNAANLVDAVRHMFSIAEGIAVAVSALSTCPLVHLSSCPPVLLSTCPLVHLSSCPPVLLSTCPL
ncbi:hypothetical protein ACOMHN_028580 [Nucella lapillus]